MKFWIYFTGTRNGEHIEAKTMKEAKEHFAKKHGVKVNSYITGKKTGTWSKKRKVVTKKRISRRK